MKDRLITEIEQAMVVEQTDKSKFDNFSRVLPR